MSKSVRMFSAAFAITVILLLAFCGFVAVDLSMERYMPGRFGPFFEIYSVNTSGVEYAFMSETRLLDFAPLEKMEEMLMQYRGLLPQQARIASEAARAVALFLFEKD